VISAILRLVAVVGQAIALLLAEATARAGAWLLVSLVSLVWSWQLGAVLDAGRTSHRGDVASVVLALGTSAAIALFGAGAGAPILRTALIGGSALVLLAGLVPDRDAARSP